MNKLLALLFAVVSTGTFFFTWTTSTHAASEDQPNLQMSVISDVHINKEKPNSKFERALNDLKTIAPGYNAIAIVGDFTDGGYEEEYQTFNNILKTYKNPAAEQLIVMGNHEYLESALDKTSTLTDEMLRKRFIDYNGDSISSIYFDKWINDYHFISLAGELSYKSLVSDTDPAAVGYAYISETQYQWLEKTLSVNASSLKPIFVFLHWPITNTVYGSIRWHAGFDDQRLLTILKKYPQAILFSGHSHYLLNHPKSIYQDGFTMVNTSSVEYTWSEGGEVPTLSQGFLVNVYDDRVELKAREFSNGTWIRTNTIPIPFKADAKDLSEPTFNGNSNNRINNLGASTVTFSWDQGIDNTTVDRYIIKRGDKVIQNVYSPYWNPEERVLATINNLFPNTSYTYEVYAVDAWDNVSLTPIKISFTTQSVNGWYLSNNIWYYFNNDGIMQSGWLFNHNLWYYLDPSGAMEIGWAMIDGKWYYFTGTGEMKTNWVKNGELWYFLDETGAMQTGWLYKGNNWYFLNTNGAMQTGWLLDGNQWYLFAPNGAMVTEWAKVTGKWYFFDKSGVMQTGWLELNNQWYYFTSDGVMVTNSYMVDGKWYYFDSNGQWKY